MDRFTVDTPMRCIFQDNLLSPLRKYLVYCPDNSSADGTNQGQDERFPDKPLKDCASGWAAEGVVRGLNYLAREMELGRIRQYFVYGDEACSDDALKRDVNLIKLSPADTKPADSTDKPYIVVAGGGAYKCVSTLVESLPTAVHFVRKGYTVFLLTYRVNTDKAALKALDDLAAALKYISDHAKELGINGNAYALCGFSASANLISNFGVPGLGFKKYGLSKPAAMFPIYTFIDLKTRSQHNCIGDLLKPMFGDDHAVYIDKYNLVDHIDKDFPPCYIVCGRDDMSVPPSNSERLKQLLDGAGVPAILEEGDHAPHAFGDGTGTDVEGWPEKAVDFLEKLTAGT
ncbi:MAG: alpha/beta hydrolase [Clostridiales bacterium]|nr:alpha/beta hydrolase [Clostridiales bacterium]